MRRTIHYYTHHGRRKHQTTLLRYLGAHVFVPYLIIVLATFVVTGTFIIPKSYTFQLGALLLALCVSVARLLISYVISLGIGIPLALLAERNRHIESILLPIYDIFQSIPLLAFFPVIILFFVQANLLEGAALFMLIFTMVWSIVFNITSGLKVIPEDVKAVGKVFGMTCKQQLLRITLPALFPSLVTGSILAFAAGWNVIIVAEALRAYAPQSSNAHNLFGIGSVLVQSAANGDHGALLTALALVVIFIAAVNLCIWQPVLARAEKYKFE